MWQQDVLNLQSYLTTQEELPYKDPVVLPLTTRTFGSYLTRLGWHSQVEGVIANVVYSHVRYRVLMESWMNRCVAGFMDILLLMPKTIVCSWMFN